MNRCLSPIILSLLLVATASAQVVRDELREVANTCESQLVDLFRNRAELSADQTPMNEFRADLRILQRWLAGVGAAAKQGSELQIVAKLRTMDLAEIIKLADDRTEAPTRPQQEAMIRLRKLTYALPASPEVAALDKTLAEAAKDAAMSLGLPAPKPGSCRPDPIDTSPAASAGPVTLESQALRIRNAAISVDLRRQILALIDACKLVKDDPDAQGEYTALSDAVSVAVRLTDALAANTAVAPNERVNLEERLATSLLLIADSRTRDAGRRRLDAMDDYRKLVDAIAGLELGGEVAVQLQPALVYARTHPNRRETILKAIDQYVRVVTAHDRRPRPAGELPANFARAAQTLAERFKQERQDVLTSAANLGEGAFQTNPNDLSTEVQKLVDLGELVTALEQLPVTFERLNRSKPLPTGAIEDRAKKLAVIAVDGSGEDATNAQAYLRGLHRIRIAAETLEAAAAQPVPAEIDDQYASGRIGSLVRWVPGHVAELAKASAEGKAIDAAAITRLETGARLIDVARKMTETEQSLKAADALRPWCDWRLKAETLRQAIGGYRAAYADALTGVMSGRDDAVARFEQADAAYRPLIREIAEMAKLAPACQAMPGPPQAALDRLATPSAEAPFARTRQLGLMIRELAGQSGKEGKEAEEALKSRLAEVAKLLAGD